MGGQHICPPFGLKRRHCRQPFVLPTPYIPRLCRGLFIYCRPRCQLDYGLVFFLCLLFVICFHIAIWFGWSCRGGIAANRLCYPPPTSPACAGDCLLCLFLTVTGISCVQNPLACRGGIVANDLCYPPLYPPPVRGTVAQ